MAEAVAELLPKDPRKWCEAYQHKRKVVHDAVWGTIRVESHEAAFIDTPLFQRLRRIHQTGAAHLTYPGARHTRFEHSLGVMHQADKMCRALQQNGEAKRVSDDVIQHARMAALFHDTGHGPFSHTSEQYYGGHEAFEEFQEGSNRFSESGAGELLSCLIATSEPIQEFVRELNRTFSTPIDSDIVAGYISGSLRAGDRYKSEIIHGPFDADKLDYMFRDGHFSGLEVPIDLDRLFYSISISTDVEGKLYRLCGSSSATSPLMQIAFNKMLLFAGMYHHHKVRAVDCMLWSVFDLAKRKGCRVGGRQLREPADYLRITDDELLVPSLCDDDELRALIDSIRNRRLWRRALVISKATVPSKHHDSELGDGSYHRLITLSENNAESIQEKRKIASLIAERAKCSPEIVWLDVPKPPSAGEAQNMWIRLPGVDQPITLGMVMPIKEWVEIYSNTRYTAHVFCPEEHRCEVNRASIEVLGNEFGLTFEPTATSYAKLED